MNFHEHLWNSVEIHGFQWKSKLFYKIHSNSYKFIDISRNPQICMKCMVFIGIHRFSLKFMDFHINSLVFLRSVQPASPGQKKSGGGQVVHSLRKSIDIGGNQWISMKFNAFQWQLMNSYENLYISMNIIAFLWKSINLNETSMKYYGHERISMKIYEFSWIQLEINRFQYNCFSFNGNQWMSKKSMNVSV